MMKRRLFLSATGAVALASCGGHGVVPALRSLGGGGGGGAGTHAPSGPFTFVPATPDAIPANVLASPMLGEARRFAGTTAPPGWLFMDGQAVPVNQYPGLFAILGRAPDDKGKDTFILRNPGAGAIVAAEGSTPGSPQAYARMRDLSYQTSLGPDAHLPPTKPRIDPKGTIEGRAVLAAAVRARSGSPEELSPDASAAMDRARTGAYGAASAALNPRTAAVVRDAVAAAVEGRTTVYDAVGRVAGTISVPDAWAALAINDRLQRAFSATPAQHRDPQREAATFLVTNAMTAEQAAAIAERG
jgi:microcystin-dependent protein